MLFRSGWGMQKSPVRLLANCFQAPVSWHLSKRDLRIRTLVACRLKLAACGLLRLVLDACRLRLVASGRLQLAACSLAPGPPRTGISEGPDISVVGKQYCLLLYSSSVYSCRIHCPGPELGRCCLPELRLTYAARISPAAGRSYARTYELLNFLVQPQVALM